MSKTVLLIEDEKSLSVLLRNRLMAEDCEVLTAANGAEGLSVALNKHPDLIVLDLLMPEMDGITLLQNLRQDPWGKKVPVTVLSNVSDMEHVFRSLNEGAVDYLIKADWSLDATIEHITDRLDAPVKT